MAQAERIIYENFKPLSNEIVIDLPGEIEIKYWNKEQIRVLTVIKSENFDKEMLSTLIDLGRYNIDYLISDKCSIITMPKIIDSPLFQNGDKIMENLKFEIRLPEGLLVKEKAKD